MTRRTREFGKRSGGGRRQDNGVYSGLPAQLVSLSTRHRAILINISSTGARVRADSPPKKGSEVFLVVQDLEIYGRIVWKSGELCGLRFETAVRAFDVEMLRREAAGAADQRMTPQQKGGADDWRTGVAR